MLGKSNVLCERSFLVNARQTVFIHNYSNKCCCLYLHLRFNDEAPRKSFFLPPTPECWRSNENNTNTKYSSAVADSLLKLTAIPSEKDEDDSTQKHPCAFMNLHFVPHEAEVEFAPSTTSACVCCCNRKSILFYYYFIVMLCRRRKKTIFISWKRDGK